MKNKYVLGAGILAGLFIAAAGGVLLQLKAGSVGIDKASQQFFPAPAPGRTEPHAAERFEHLLVSQRDWAKVAVKSGPGDVIDRQLIKTAHLSIEVQEFNAASKEVERLTVKAGGYVLRSNSYLTDAEHRKGSITIRVPETTFLSVVQELEKVGDVKSRSISAQDVTEEYIDLGARLKNYEKQQARLLEILSKAEGVEEILTVEEQLGRIRGEIERLTGRLRYLNERIEMATITLELYEPEPITQSWGLRNALKLAVAGFITTVNSLIVFAGYVLPLAAILSAAYYYRKRRSELLGVGSG